MNYLLVIVTLGSGAVVTKTVVINLSGTTVDIVSGIADTVRKVAYEMARDAAGGANGPHPRIVSVSCCFIP